MKHRLKRLPLKIRGREKRKPATFSPKQILWTFVTAISAIATLVVTGRLAECQLLIAPFAASAVLVFGEFESPLAQPRNLVGGHVFSAAVGVGIGSFFGHSLWATAIAVGIAIVVMHLTHTTHPPGGATAFLAVQGQAGPEFVVVPVLSGCLILLTVALFTNNIVHHRQYPRHWL